MPYWLLLFLLLVRAVLCNTEAFTFQVPHYYDIPHGKLLAEIPQIEDINSTTSRIEHFPISTIAHYDLTNRLISLPYNYLEKPSGTLFVKVNNYNGTTYKSNDLINVKLCWPATTPLNFRLSHRYLRTKDFGLAPTHGDESLEIYIEIHYEGDYYAVRQIQESSADFYLVISKLPNKLPIPIELYDLIMFIVDGIIVMTWLSPFIQDGVVKILG